ncbi:pre-16S rRNA-processing nuclease YqgF [Candidatus Kaiserbacteria bacterium]|nr:pre-16S rRNA-processing nuclease YqgF [Candidatus Kaiserbacteria bacterium]
MRILGIDYGTSGVGLAISDENASFAFPLETLHNDAFLLENIVHVATEKKVSAIAIGDTRAEGGGANRVTAQADAFMEKLRARVGVPVHAVREAWSSLEASRFAPKGKERDDAASAAIILQRFLDSGAKR